LTPLATDIANISIQMKNINDRFDQISTESKQFKEINSELENQIVQLKACLKIEQQNCKSLQDEIVIKDKKIKIQQDEIKNLQTTGFRRI
jgi:chromosome segregation ATPase